MLHLLMPTDNPGQQHKTQKYSLREQFPDPGSLDASPCLCLPAAPQLQPPCPSWGCLSQESLFPKASRVSPSISAHICCPATLKPACGTFGGEVLPWLSSSKPRVTAHWISAGTWWTSLPMEHPSGTGGACPVQHLSCAKSTLWTTCWRDAAGRTGQGPTAPTLAQPQQRFKL